MNTYKSKEKTYQEGWLMLAGVGVGLVVITLVALVDLVTGIAIN